LEVLITYSLSAEIFSIFRKDSLVATHKCYFSLLDCEYDSIVKHFPHMFRALSLIPSTTQIKKK
jgi:hypothetical protein